MKPGARLEEIFTLSELLEGDLVIVRSDEMSKDDAVILEASLRGQYPAWRGAILVLSTDQSIEKMNEPMARDLWVTLTRYFVSKDKELEKKILAAREKPTEESESSTKSETGDGV